MKDSKLDRKQSKLLLLLFAGVLMGALDIAIIGPAIPAIITNLGITIQDASWIFNIYLISNLVGVPIFSKISDNYGRRDIYIICILLFALGSLIIVFSTSYQFLLVGRAIQGLGSGGIFPVASAIIGDTFPMERQGSALGMIGAVFGIAFIIGPIIGGILLLWSWHYIFLINIPIAIVIIFFAYKLVPTIKNKETKKFDFIGLVILSAILISLSFSLNSLHSENTLSNITQPYIIFPLILSLILIPIFIKIEKKSENPIVSIKLFKNQNLVVTYLLGFGAGIAESIAMFLPLFAEKQFNVSHSSASFMMIPMVIALALGAPTSGRLLDSKGPRFSIIIGIVVLIMGFTSFNLISQTIYGFYIAGTLVGFGLSFLLGAPLRYMVNTNTNSLNRGSGQGLVSISTNTGQILSIALLGSILNGSMFAFDNYKKAFTILLSITFVLLAISFKIPKREKETI